MTFKQIAMLGRNLVAFLGFVPIVSGDASRGSCCESMFKDSCQICIEKRPRASPLSSAKLPEHYSIS